MIIESKIIDLIIFDLIIIDLMSINSLTIELIESLTEKSVELLIKSSIETLIESDCPQRRTVPTEFLVSSRFGTGISKLISSRSRDETEKSKLVSFRIPSLEVSSNVIYICDNFDHILMLIFWLKLWKIDLFFNQNDD